MDAHAPARNDHYAVLGVEVGADAAEVRRAWRRLAVKWHPDRAGASATFIFQKILAAYTVLSDPAARAAYDRQRGTPPGSPASARAPAASAAPAPARRAPSVMLARLSGPLEALVRCGIAPRTDDGAIELLLDADEAAQGGMATISMRVAVRCPACSAGVAGGEPASAAGAAPCARCGGRRAVGELYSAWLAIRPGAAEGTLLEPSAQLAGVVRPVTFRLRLRPAPP